VAPSLECTLFEQASTASHVSNIVDLQFFALEHGSSAKQLEKRKTVRQLNKYFIPGILLL
jgi:hypothetical protein